jgi:NAD(P)H-flavin reductase
MLLYREELEQWSARDDIRMHITVDQAPDPDWPWHTGFVPAVTERVAPRDDGNTLALVCGPPVMIKFTRPVLEKLGYPASRIILSLENRMKCGIGMCGRCNIGRELVCRDGPVFSLEAVEKTPGEY